MKNWNLKKTLIVVGFTLACLFAFMLEQRGVNSKGHWYSVVPPFLAILMALLTQRLIPSFIVAVLSGSLLTVIPEAPFSPSKWGEGLYQGGMYFYASLTDWWSLKILLFALFVLIMIAVMIASGGLQGTMLWVAERVKNRKMVQLSAALSGLALFIDDYANSIIVGSAMRPLTDRYRISREKLAFIVDATSAPISGIAFVSTWIGYEVGLFKKAAESLKLDLDGYAMFFDVLGFRFYCLFMIVFVLVNVLKGRDFGPMALAEKRAEETGEVAAPDAKVMSSEGYMNVNPYSGAKLHPLSFIIPVTIMLIYLFLGLWVDGGGMAKMGESFFAIFNPLAWREVIVGAENNATILMHSSLLGLIVAALLAKFIGQLPIGSIARSIYVGIKGSLLPLGILVCAWALKAACDGLHTGDFLSAAVGSSLSPLWFPTLIFLVASVVAFSTGTSWGTMAILIPTTFPIAFGLDGDQYGLVSMISLAAILDGAILGDHCSPISDTTIMSSMATSCDHLHHVRTQLPYSLVVGSIAIAIGYIPAAFGVSSLISLIVGMVAIFLLFNFIGRQSQQELT